MSFTRLTLAASLALGLSACSGAGVGGILGGLNPINAPISIQCDTGTQVQLANPQAGQAGVSGNIGQIVIVANGQNNALYDSYGQWYLTLVDQYTGQTVRGGNLSLTPDPNGPHPYASDFYYSSSIPQLPSGETWNVQLYEQNAACGPVPLQSFST